MTGYVHAIHRRYVHAIERRYVHATETGTCTDDRACQGTCTPSTLVCATELRVWIGEVDSANPDGVFARAVCRKALSAQYIDFERVLRPRMISTTSYTFYVFYSSLLYWGSPP